MDDFIAHDPPRSDTERYVVSGWAALEAGDLAGARAALQDLYTADPTHPALRVLAAGIRRARPKPVPWRALVFAIALAAVAVYGLRTWRLQNRAVPVETRNEAPAAVPEIPPSTAPQPAATPTEKGTAGQIQTPPLPTAKQNTSSPAVDEDVVVRQVIQRFEGAYQNRWGALAFSHCDVSRGGDTATATCEPRLAAGAGGETDQLWTFSLRKVDGSWKIESVQPPPDKR